MMTSPKHLRERARDCMNLSKSVPSYSDRTMLEDIAAEMIVTAARIEWDQTRRCGPRLARAVFAAGFQLLDAQLPRRDRRPLQSGSCGSRRLSQTLRGCGSDPPAGDTISRPPPRSNNILASVAFPTLIQVSRIELWRRPLSTQSRHNDASELPRGRVVVST